MKPSVPLSWPQVLLEIWASIFVLGQTSNLRRAHKQFMTCLKEQRGGRMNIPGRSRTWQIEVDVKFCFVFFLICGSWWCWWWWGRCVRWRWVCFVCHLPAGERLSTGVPWSGAARVHDLQPREVREQKSSRPSITRAKSRGFFFLFNAARMKLATISVILLERMQRTETFLPLALFAL